MSQIYGTATVTKDNKTYRLDPEFQNIMAESRDADELEWAWLTWRNITGPVIKPKFQQLVSDMNEAAQDNGKTVSNPLTESTPNIPSFSL